jgi:peptide deformylase
LAEKPARPPGPVRPTVPQQWSQTADGLVVEREESNLAFVNGQYRCQVRRELFNAGSEPITRFPIRIAVDRYPGEPDRSNRHHRDHPLTWDELNLEAHCGDEPMRWQRRHDRDAYKEVWLLFENDESHFALYPGRRATVAYAYTVSEDKWGPWFQRVVRVPTRRLALRLDLPASAQPVVWGVAGSLTSEGRPLQTPVRETVSDDRRLFEWSTENPPLNSRYRLEWRFREGEAVVPAQRSPKDSASEVTRRLGIVQRGAPVLERAVRWLDLPDQRNLAADVVERLRDATDRLGRLRQFRWGVALAAPQLGISWAVAVVQPTDANRPLVLLNPRIVSESVDHEEHFEQCLSFVDVRGRVSRPRLVEVEYAAMDGHTTIATFTGTMARVVTHAIDHLAGLLYPDRMPADGRLVPAAGP